MKSTNSSQQKNSVTPRPPLPHLYNRVVYHVVRAQMDCTALERSTIYARSYVV